jgi:peptide subunit release factor 1 (eRF1)
MPLVIEEQGCVEELARLFPALPTIHVLARVQSLVPGRARLQETTVLEFGGQQYAVFMATLPWKFDERVQLVLEKKGRSAEAAVIALQYKDGRKAVAVRFLEGSCDWMMQP